MQQGADTWRTNSGDDSPVGKAVPGLRHEPARTGRRKCNLPSFHRLPLRNRFRNKPLLDSADSAFRAGHADFRRGNFSGLRPVPTNARCPSMMSSVSSVPTCPFNRIFPPGSLLTRPLRTSSSRKRFFIKANRFAFRVRVASQTRSCRGALLVAKQNALNMKRS